MPASSTALFSLHLYYTPLTISAFPHPSAHPLHPLSFYYTPFTSATPPFSPLHRSTQPLPPTHVFLSLSLTPYIPLHPPYRCLMVENRVWGFQHELRQFVGALKPHTLMKLEEKNCNLDKIFEMSASEVSQVGREDVVRGQWTGRGGTGKRAQGAE